jgi:hypothetical protein
MLGGGMASQSLSYEVHGLSVGQSLPHTLYPSTLCT